MSFEQLQEVLWVEAKQQLARINDQYDKELKAEEKRIQAEARRIEEDIITEAEREGQQEGQRLHQVAQLKARADVLLTKQTELENVLEEAKKTILGWPEAERKEMVQHLLSFVEEDEGELYPGEIDENIVRQIGEKKGFKVKKETIKGEGGFIYRGDKTEMNLTVGALLRQLFDSQRAEIARVLFE